MAVSPRVSPQSFADLAGSIAGIVIEPDHPEYEDARRVRNGLVDRRPAAIVRCASETDVTAAVGYARSHSLVLSIRGGGHGVAGAATNDGGLVIDLSGMRKVTVDPAARRATVQGGATWGDVDQATQAYGLMTPGGVVSSTGVGGLTLHGGLGHARRKYGLSLDSVRRVDIVTSDGLLRHASATENPDLFWAVLGAGSNFGVVTSFEFELYPLGPDVALGAVMYPLADARRITREFRDFAATVSEEISLIMLLWNIPDSDHFPPELRGVPVAVVAGVYSGEVEEGLRLLQPIREWGAPVLDISGPIPYADLQTAFDPYFPKGRNYYWKSKYIDELPDHAIETMVEAGEARPSPMSAVTLWQLGGAITRGNSQTSFGRRDAPFLLSAEATWEGHDNNDRQIAWSRDLLDAMEPYSKGGLYINFPGFAENRDHMVKDAFGANLERLEHLKARYDPTNLFSRNLNLARTS